jgi:hypothetical protein
MKASKSLHKSAKKLDRAIGARVGANVAAGKPGNDPIVKAMRKARQIIRESAAIAARSR